MDAQIVEEGRRGCQQATLVLWEAHKGLVLAVLSAHGARPEELEDLAQEVALRMCRGLSTIQDPGCFRAWLRRVTINVAHGDARRQSRERRHFASTREVDPEEGHSLRLLREEEDVRSWAETALRLVGDLPIEYREPLLLRAVEGLSQKKIAEALELPETTVETRLARARRMLRKLFRAQQDHVPGISSEGRDRYAR